MLAIAFSFFATAAVQAAWSKSSLEKHVDVLSLLSGFVLIVGNEFIGDTHHHSTPFVVPPDGKVAYIAYLEGNRYPPNPKSSVHVQQISLDTFNVDGDAVFTDGAEEASGLAAHDDGFALLTHLNMTEKDPEQYWIPTVVRYKNGKQAWSTPVGRKTVTFQIFPDTSFRANKGSLNGDLVFWEDGTQGAHSRAEYFTGTAAGHGGDSIVYLNDKGSFVPGPYSQMQHCGHNFGLGISTSKDVPFASVCTSDDGFVRIATKASIFGGEQATIGEERPHKMFAAEALGGSRGSYSVMARLAREESYRPLKSKDSLGGDPNDITPFKSDTDCFNAHVAAFEDSRVLVTWEESTVADCDPWGCKSRIVDAAGSAQVKAFVSEDTFISGDIVKVGSKLCWPYVNMKWNSSKDAIASYGPFPEDPWRDYMDTPISTVKKMSFACVATDGLDGNSTGSGSSNTLDSSSTPIPFVVDVATASPLNVLKTKVLVSTTTVPAITSS